MQVFLQHDGTSRPFFCPRSLLELKEQIAGVSGVPQEEQRLISCGRSLETDSCLEGLEEGSTIFLNLDLSALKQANDIYSTYIIMKNIL